MKTLMKTALALWLATGFGCFSHSPPPKPVTVPEVVEMSRAGVPAGEIINRMRQAGTVYRLQASQLTELAAQGVSPDVLNHMQETYLQAVRRDAAYDNWDRWSHYGDYWYGGPSFGWPHDRIIVVRERPPPPPPPPPPPAPPPPHKPPKGRR